MDWKISIQKGGPDPIYRQIVAFVERGIESGKLQPGDRIPSSADLARKLRINKVTVVRAFRELEQKKRIDSQVGRGSFIAGGKRGSTPRPELTRSVRRLRDSYASGISQLLQVQPKPGAIHLRSGVPPDDHLPEGLLGKLTQQVTKKNPERLYPYSNIGLPEMLDELVTWLRHRGYDVERDQLLITNGSQQAIALAANWAREDGRSVFCETPTFVGVPRVFTQSGHVVESVRREQGGIRLDGLSRRTPSLLYTCAEFQNPTGETLSPAGRKAIVQHASRTDTVVLVDDIFRDMRFSGKEPKSLYSDLPPLRRIMVGSFSKSFMPGLRVGFLAADRPIVEDLASIKRYMDLGGPPLSQAVMAAFLRKGYREHLERMRSFYRDRATAATETLEARMPEGVTFTRPEGGFQLWVRMPTGLSSIQLYLEALEEGVSISPGPAHDLDGRFLNCFRIGYGHATPEEIRKGVGILSDLVRDMIARGPAEQSATGLGVPV